MRKRNQDYIVKTNFRLNSVLGLFWKAARVGERLSPYVSLACIIMGVALMRS